MSRGTHRRLSLLAATGAVTLFSSHPAIAQTASAADSGQLEEVVVTAQKRAENVQDVPLAVSSIGGPAIERLGVQNPLMLGVTVPNLSLQNNSGVTYIYLRGVGNNFLGLGVDGNVAYHTNGVYVARPRAQVASYFDVDHIEVVRGPQGDLYGRNATGGAINVITRKPTDTVSGEASLSLGNYDLVRVEAAIGGPLAGDALRARLAAFVLDRGGYGKNETTGKDIDNRKEWGARLTVEADPSDNLNLELVGDYFHADDAWGVAHQAGSGRSGAITLAESLGDRPKDIRDVVSGIDPNRFVEAWGMQGTATLQLDDAWTLKSITAYRRSRYTSSDELIGTAPSLAELSQRERQHQFSQEVQLLTGGKRWDFLAGAYYFKESVDGFIHIPLFFAPHAIFDQRGEADTEAYAAFAHGSYGFSDTLKLVVGARFGHEKRTAIGTFTAPFAPIPTGGSKSFYSFTPKVTLQWEPSSNVTVYGGVSKGFHSGGFTIGVPGPGVAPETLWSYEAGLKAQLFDRRLTANLAAFYYDYKDLVVTRVIGAQTVDENAAAATIKGFEAETIARPTRNLRLDLTLGLLDPTYDKYSTPDPVRPELGLLDLSGNRLPGASKYTARLGAAYDIPLAGDAVLTLAGDAIFNGSTYFSSYQTKNAYQPAYETYNLSVTYDSGGRWTVTAWGRNLTDKTVFANQLVSSDFWGFPRITYLRDPRTYGVDLRVKF